MAGLPWIPLAVDFPDSRKAVALGVAMQTPMAWAYIVRLWTWAARNAQDGRIEGPDAVAVIEHAAGWNGSPGALVDAASLPHIALLDDTGKGFAIHDWSDHCGAHVEKRERDRQRMRKARKANRSRTVREPSAHVPGERERETEKNTTTLSPRSEGEQAAAVIALNAPPAHPNLDALVMALRAAGKTPSYPKHENRAAVDAAIASVGIETATARVVLAWNPATPHLGWYLADILQTAPKSNHRPPKAASVNAPAGIGTEWGKAPF